jgi:hypothetical protein
MAVKRPDPDPCSIGDGIDGNADTLEREDLLCRLKNSGAISQRVGAERAANDVIGVGLIENSRHLVRRLSDVRGGRCRSLDHLAAPTVGLDKRNEGSV